MIGRERARLLQAGTTSTFLSFLVFAIAHDQRWHIYAAAALLGLGIGLAFAALANLIVEALAVGVVAGFAIPGRSAPVPA